MQVFSNVAKNASQKNLKIQYHQSWEKGLGPNGEKGIQQFDLQWFKQTLGDIVIARRDIRTSYHLASTIDDFHQNVSLVTRGNDLFYDTPIHVLLQKLFNFKIPNFYHHKLINDQNGKKLSKSKNSESLNQLRQTLVSSPPYLDLSSDLYVLIPENRIRSTVAELIAENLLANEKLEEELKFFPYIDQTKKYFE